MSKYLEEASSKVATIKSLHFQQFFQRSKVAISKYWKSVLRRKIDRGISLYYFNSQRSQSFLELNLELLVVNFPQWLGIPKKYRNILEEASSTASITFPVIFPKERKHILFQREPLRVFSKVGEKWKSIRKKSFPTGITHTVPRRTVFPVNGRFPSPRGAIFLQRLKYRGMEKAEALLNYARACSAQ